MQASDEVRANAPLLADARKYVGAFWTEFDLSSAPEFSAFLLRAGVIDASRIPNWLAIGVAVVEPGADAVPQVAEHRAGVVELATKTPSPCPGQPLPRTRRPMITIYGCSTSHERGPMPTPTASQ